MRNRSAPLCPVELRGRSVPHLRVERSPCGYEPLAPTDVLEGLMAGTAGVEPASLPLRRRTPYPVGPRPDVGRPIGPPLATMRNGMSARCTASQGPSPIPVRDGPLILFLCMPSHLGRNLGVARVGLSVGLDPPPSPTTSLPYAADVRGSYVSGLRSGCAVSQSSR